MTGNKFNGITYFLKGKRSLCAVLLAMIFLFTTSIAVYAVEPPTADPSAMTYGGKQDVELQTVAASVYNTTDNIVSNVVYAPDFAGGDGSVDNPYQVATAEQLNNVRNHLDSHFIQTADIDLNVAPYNTGEGWEPIGDWKSKFTGTFNGNDMTISNLFINRGTTYSGVGLFAFTGVKAEIKNVKLEDTTVTGKGTGSLVGWNEGTITNSYTTGTVTGTDSVFGVEVCSAGGLVGYNEDGTITNSYSTCVVTGDDYVGGLVGYNDDGTITTSYATGNVAGDYSGGGLVGYNDNGAITNSYASGTVAGNASVGGLVGRNYGGSITNSYASGDVTGTDVPDTKEVGGLVGGNANGSITGSYATGVVTGDDYVGGLVGENSGSITNSYATGAVFGNYSGGLVGYNSLGTITSSFARGAVTGTKYVGGLAGWNYAYHDDPTNPYGTITDSYASGDVRGTEDVGGLVGSNITNDTFTNSYWDTNTSGTVSSAGGEGKTTAEMKKQENYEGWDFNAIWSIDTNKNKGYPFLTGNPPVEPDNPLTITAATGGSITIGSSGNYAAGTVIDITAKPASGYSFNKWTSTGGGTFANANNASTTYTMPANSATITANFTYNSSSGGSPGGGGSSTTPSGTQVTSSGRTASQNGVTLTFPAGAVESDIQVQVKETALSAGMTLPDNSQLLSRVMDIIKDKSGNFLKPVTITLSFNNSELDPNEYDIAIYYYDEDTGKWIALNNIRLNFKSGTISGDTTHFTKFAVIANPKAINEEKPTKPVNPQPAVNIPSDISGHWAKDSIMKMINDGVISGYPDGTFKPDKTITRAEFTVMLVKALNLETRTGKTFTDTASHWAKDSISTAAVHGIISGYDANTFGPNNLITREQAAVTVSLAAKLEAVTGELNFTDSKAISPWAKPGVAEAFEGGFITGYPDNSFKPQGNTTRAEAVSLILKVI